MPATLVQSYNKFKKNLLDDRLNGTWIAKDKSGSFKVKKLQNGTIEIISKNNKDHSSEHLIATVYNSNINNNNYLSIHIENRDDLKNGYLIAKYALDDSGTLKFAYISSPELKKLVKSKKINGYIQKEFFFSSVTINDTSENIKQLITKYDNLLFKNYMFFSRTKS